MPSIEENTTIWDDSFDWAARGEEWSTPWGGSASQWRETIFPRISRFLPAGTILEIAPGYGRWTQYLREHCRDLVLVDLSPRCIRACQERFGQDRRISYHVNNGRSLEALADGSIDFVFSFDSLVHAEADVMADYLRELARKLRPTGCGFIHHSNAGEYARYFETTKLLPQRVRSALYKARALDNDHFRGLSMTARRFHEYCDLAGIYCISQELVNWDSRRLIDCLSTITRSSAAAQQRREVIENNHFMEEAARAKRMAAVRRRLLSVDGHYASH